MIIFVEHFMEALDPLSIEKIAAFMPISDLSQAASAYETYNPIYEQRMQNVQTILMALLLFLVTDQNRLAFMFKASTETQAHILYILTAEKMTRINGVPQLRETKWLEHANFAVMEHDGWVQAHMLDDEGNPLFDPREQVDYLIARDPPFDLEKAVKQTMTFLRQYPIATLSLELAYIDKHYTKHRRPVPMLDNWSVLLDRYWTDYYDLKMMSYYYSSTNDLKNMKQEEKADTPIQEFNTLCAYLLGQTRE